MINESNQTKKAVGVGRFAIAKEAVRKFDDAVDTSGIDCPSLWSAINPHPTNTRVVFPLYANWDDFVSWDSYEDLEQANQDVKVDGYAVVSSSMNFRIAQMVGGVIGYDVYGDDEKRYLLVLVQCVDASDDCARAFDELVEGVPCVYDCRTSDVVQVDYDEQGNVLEKPKMVGKFEDDLAFVYIDQCTFHYLGLMAWTLWHWKVMGLGVSQNDLYGVSRRKIYDFVGAMMPSEERACRFSSLMVEDDGSDKAERLRDIAKTLMGRIATSEDNYSSDTIDAYRYFFYAKDIVTIWLEVLSKMPPKVTTDPRRCRDREKTRETLRSIGEEAGVIPLLDACEKRYADLLE